MNFIIVKFFDFQITRAVYIYMLSNHTIPSFPSYSALAGACKYIIGCEGRKHKKEGGNHMSSDNKSQSEVLLSSDCKPEAEEMAQLLAEINPGNKNNLEMFLKAVDFIDTWKKPA